ncbi:adenylate/guanylate cyclase domain-containing protein [Oligoflexus tunisiensis]|uniref:adenylate/guanylate cyclase domain-containing protein n=1 Tax=Oligoflexus tunisiensis TaxID=708132 RepID=UPI00114D12D8|nr:adenylate/guanylate cyclase domain-containing protein [Oligoflexus tunisiensis]
MDSQKTKKPLIKFSKRRILNGIGPYSAVGCAAVAALMTHLFISLGGFEVRFDFFAYIFNHFLLSIPFSLAFFLNLPMRFATERKTKKLLVKHLTFFFILIHGTVGTCTMLRQLPDVINVYPGYFWFTYGLVSFFMGGASFLNLLLYGGVYFVFVFHSMVAFGDFTLHEKFTIIFMLFQLVHFTPVALLARSRITAIRHAFRQMEKVFYPHQIQMIRRARELEQTMPTAAGEACVICFDIISSSQIQHENLKKFLRNIFARCNTIMMEGYNGIDMAARGYRIKEMGDGFLCSVGYPFRSHGESLARDAVDLALDFHEVFKDEVRQLEYDKPIHCGLGIAFDAIAGFYPESGAKEYDLHGRSIVLATRYEAMRNSLFPQRPPSSVLILQERVWSSLKADERSRFVKVDLRDRGLTVRDDPKATLLCYQLLDARADAEASQPVLQGHDLAG